MQIDWLTVIAQTINFLILVWLLKRFLYKPVIGAMTEREALITARLQEAAERERAADESKTDYQHKLDTWDAERGRLLGEAAAAAAAERKTIGEQARNEVAEQRRLWQRQVTDEKDSFLRDMKRQTAETIVAISRRSLRDLADVELEERIIDSFLGKLAALPDARRHVVDPGDESVRVTTAFVLNAETRRRITDAVGNYLGRDVDVAFSESDALLCGIELTVAGQRLSWTVASYIEELEQRLQEQLEKIGAAS